MSYIMFQIGHYSINGACHHEMSPVGQNLYSSFQVLYESTLSKL